MAATIDSYQLSSSSIPGDAHGSCSSVVPASSPCRPLTARHPRPIPNSYWATPALLACEYPWCPGSVSPKLDALLNAGVRAFIDLTEPGELRPYAASALVARAEALGIDPTTISYSNFPIPDRKCPKSRGYMHAILAALAQFTQEGKITAVHCRGGIGRTGMVVGCWLVSSGAAKDGEEALGMIAREWATVEKCKRFPCSPETGAQFEFVRTWRMSKTRNVAAC